MSKNWRMLVLQKDPRMFLRLGDSDGFTLIRDTVKNHNGFTWGLAGIDQPGAIVGDRDGSASFNNSQVEAAYSAELNTAVFSAFIWANPDSTTGTYRTVMMNRNSTTARGWNFYQGDNNRWQAWLGLTGGAWTVADSGLAAVAGKWTFLALTYDGSRVKFYVDGILRTNMVSAFFPNVDTKLTVGRTYQETLPFVGDLDEAAVFQHVLSSEEILDLYHAGRAVPDIEIAAAVEYDDEKVDEDGSRRLPSGPIDMEVECYRVDINCKPKEDLSDDFIGGYVDWHEEREGGSMWGGEVQLRDPRKLRLLSDYLAIWVTLVYGDGRRIRRQLGQFTFDAPSEWHNSYAGEGTFRLKDMTVLLDQARFSRTLSNPAGTSFVSVMRDHIELAGIARHDIRDSSQTMGFGRTWYRGHSTRYSLGRMTKALGWYPVHMEMDGSLASLPLRDFRQVNPSISFWGHEYDNDAGIVVEPSGDPIANVVQVLSKDPAKDTIFWEEINDDPQSPTAVQNISPPREIVKQVMDNEIETLAAAKARARAELNKADSYDRTLRLSTLPNLDPGIYRTADVRFKLAKLSPQGRYYIRGWRIGLSPQDALTSFELGRLFEVNFDV